MTVRKDLTQVTWKCLPGARTRTPKAAVLAGFPYQLQISPSNYELHLNTNTLSPVLTVFGTLNC